MTPTEPTKLLEVKNLKKYFPIKRGIFKRIVGYLKAVDDISFYIQAGETLGLVGESGCGKTTTGRLIIHALPLTDGEILFHQADQTIRVDKLHGQTLKAFRRNMQLIFQDPYSSLNPRMTTLEIIGEPLLVNNVARGRELEDRVRHLMQIVGLNTKYLRRYPHAFSGGQRQRIGIARALALNPKLIIADEPVSALDVSIQAQTLNLLRELQHELKLTYLFISHDLSVVRYICNRVAVMYVGKIVEIADTQTLYRHPRHPYTAALLSAVPKPDPKLAGKWQLLEGEVADPANPPDGCFFHPRCKYAQPICRETHPVCENLGDEHYVNCHFARVLSLTGIG
jgi:peptide/nickel transport system ATP-binding protein